MNKAIVEASASAVDPVQWLMQWSEYLNTIWMIPVSVPWQQAENHSNIPDSYIRVDISLSKAYIRKIISFARINRYTNIQYNTSVQSSIWG